MKLLPILLASVFVLRATTFCDSVGSIGPVVAASAFGPCFFTELPNGSAAAYELKEDGSFRLLWRISRLEDFGARSLLSQDGRYLVRYVRSPDGSPALEEESLQEPVLTFYDRGRKIAQYTCAQLVKDRSKVRYSTSHYLWLADGEAESLQRPGEKPQEPPPVLNDDEHAFALKTIDGLVFQFDIQTGKILFDHLNAKDRK